MFKVEAVIQPTKLADVLASLHDLDVSGISISEVLHHGGPSAKKLVYRGAEYSADLPMLNLGMVHKCRAPFLD